MTDTLEGRISETDHVESIDQKMVDVGNWENVFNNPENEKICS